MSNIAVAPKRRDYQVPVQAGEYSVDGRFVFDGRRWVSAINAGETHRWNGREWVELRYKAMTRTYRNVEEFQQDAKRLAPYGWRPQVAGDGRRSVGGSFAWALLGSLVASHGRRTISGSFAWALLGGLVAGTIGRMVAGAVGPHEKPTVTYVRD